MEGTHKSVQSPNTWVTADSLIESFGDQAYHKGLRMAAEALQAGDREACHAVADALFDLMERGYHKREEADSNGNILEEDV